MKAITKLTVAALGAASIAGGVALAQDNSSSTLQGRANAEAKNMNPDTANYGTPPGAPLKRDGSLSGGDVPAAAPMAQAADTSTTTTTTQTTTAADAPVAPVADTASTDTAASSPDASLQPRSDRN